MLSIFRFYQFWKVDELKRLVQSILGTFLDYLFINTIFLKRNVPTLTVNSSASLFPILKNFVSFVNYRKFPVTSCNPHFSILLCLEMRAIWKKILKFKITKIEYSVLLWLVIFSSTHDFFLFCVQFFYDFFLIYYSKASLRKSAVHCWV